jgi:hypothetical protein
MTLGDAGGRSANRRGRRRQEGGDVRGRPGDAVFTEYRGRPLELDGDRVYQFSLEWRLGQTMDPIIRKELMQDGSNLREIGHQLQGVLDEAADLVGEMKSRGWTCEIHEWGQEDPAKVSIMIDGAPRRVLEDIASLSPRLASTACWRLRVWNPDVEADLHLYYWAVPDSGSSEVTCPPNCKEAEEEAFRHAYWEPSL